MTVMEEIESALAPALGRSGRANVRGPSLGRSWLWSASLPLLLSSLRVRLLSARPLGPLVAAGLG
eukprot:4455780-Pyramimonas_sp.AAC.1